MTNPAVTPTPDEITAARELLLRVPGVRGTDTLNDIERQHTPTARMGRELVDWINRNPGRADLTGFGMASLLAEAAARHGLRITTDPGPGELIGHYCVQPYDDNGEPWTAMHRVPGTLAEVRNSAAEDARRRVAVMYLLPEGGE
ncbi:hypothetical protein AB0J48_20660 [Nocardia salmonicida]|uniref:hypothetical protein n=1 Tax=Nocardia salmonicida TaxID=53431 RepID=UPI003441A96E